MNMVLSIFLRNLRLKLVSRVFVYANFVKEMIKEKKIYIYVWLLLIRKILRMKQGFWMQDAGATFAIFKDTFFFIKLKFSSRMLTGVDTGCFWHWCIDFGNTNLGMPKFNLNKIITTSKCNSSFLIITIIWT